MCSASEEGSMLRFLVNMKLMVLFALWSFLCLALYGVLALIEAVLEIGAGVAGAPVGQGGTLSGLVDLGGDIIQWGVGLMWLVGLVALWLIRRILISREARAQAGRYAVKAATTAAPYVISRHPLGKAVNMARGPAGRFLGGILARKMGRKH
jgi:hypothetical protein